MIGGRKARLAFSVSGVAIFAFVMLLVFALVRLWGPAAETRRHVDNNMLWALSQAHAATLLLDSAVARRAGGVPGDVALERRYNVLLSRLNLLTQGPQARYLADRGFAEPIERRKQDVLALDPQVSSLSVGDVELAGRIHGVLGPLEQLLGRAANKAMVSQWNAIGERLDAEHSAIVQVIASILAIAGLGGMISILMVRAVLANQQAQQALRRETEMREAYRSFVDLVSHQFRTPLSVMDASMQRILRRGELMPREEIAQRVRRMRHLIGDLTTLIDTTLDGMQADAGKIEVCEQVCDPVALLENVRHRQLEATPGRLVDLNVGANVPRRVLSDPVLVEQVLANLLSNAIKYSPEGERVVVTLQADGDSLAFSVRDDGIGIPDDEQGQVFSRFFRARTAAGYPGTGVGLNVSRRIAETLGGSLSLRSKQGLGSTFTLQLPLVPAELGEDHASAPPSGRSHKTRRQPVRTNGAGWERP
ncbi:sensor histidine kinase [Amorphus orientalis]|uniref:histidine kinase n=1 Tax=Amorphus orientalis TaxID=649198 RepID=A0AAE4ASD6_9HYPH|nr:HAMP domain-containing sensor histidine kinase [Amorphus orientalis]MDQ0315012.1 signal transduction histidine kinase [Amorphus orientalis]